MVDNNSDSSGDEGVPPLMERKGYDSDSSDNDVPPLMHRKDFDSFR